MTRQQILAAAVLAVGGIGLAGTTSLGQATADQQPAPTAGQSSSPSSHGQSSATPGAGAASSSDLSGSARPAGASAGVQAGQSDIRQALSQTTNAVVGQSGSAQLGQQIAQADQSRLTDWQKDSQQLDQSVQQLRQAYKEKYNKDLDLSQASDQVFSSDFFRIGGAEAQTASGRIGADSSGISGSASAGGAGVSGSAGAGAGATGVGASGNAGQTTAANSGAPDTSAGAGAGASSGGGVGASAGAGATGVGASGNAGQTTAAQSGAPDTAAGAAHSSGGLSGSAVAAGSQAGAQATSIVIPASHNMPEARINLVQDAGSWKIDLPDAVDSKQLSKKLQEQVAKCAQMKDQWPADANEAARAISHSVLLAFSDSAGASGASGTSGASGATGATDSPSGTGAGTGTNPRDAARPAR